MKLPQKRRRRVELLIDQRLVGFLKPPMTVSQGPVQGVPRAPQDPVGDVLPLSAETRRENKAS